MIEKKPEFILVNAAYPHVGKKIKLFWGQPEFPKLMDELQNDTRKGHRKGFPADVMLALAILDSLHAVAFPRLARKQTDIWKAGPV